MFVPQHTAFCIYFIHPRTTHPRTTHPRTTKPQTINPWTTTPPELGQYLLHAQPICNTQTRNMLYMFDDIFIDLQTSELREEIYEKDNFKATQRVYYNCKHQNQERKKSVTKYM